MKRGFFGGTFNPPHLGHIRAAAAAAKQLGLEELYWIPAGIPPHKELPDGSADNAQRLEMSKLAAAEIPGAQVLDWEMNRPGRSYTADTVERLLAEKKDGELWMLCGTDMLETLPEWYRGEWLMQTLCVAVYPRHEGETAHLHDLAAAYGRDYGTKVEVIDMEPTDVSSTMLRTELAQGRGAALLSRSVYGYVLRNRLYGVRPEPEALWELAKEWYAPKRIPHVLGCRETAVKLAQRWGEDLLDAETAAILHDITKKTPVKEQLQFCEKCGIMTPNISEEYEATLHAFSGAAAAELEFGISDRVRDAIMWHTTGKADMTLLEKIIWLADYMEPTRKTEGLEEIRTLAYSDLDAALCLAMEKSIRYMEEAGFHLHPATGEALACLRKEIHS